MKYLSYSIEDFLMDENFQQWVQHPTPEQNAFWHSFLTQHPHKSNDVEEARKLLLFFNFKKFSPSLQEHEEVLQKIYRQSPSPAKVTEKAATKRFHLRSWLKYAAAITVVLVSSLLLVKYFSVVPTKDIVQITTVFGEKKRLVLPDSSVVFLNANSQLSYAAHWSTGHSTVETPLTREVWLEGEAFFEVQHHVQGEQPSTFVVHTPSLDVEVLGTTFNVNNRRNKTQVVLNTGKIKLKASERHAQREALYMSPGEMVEFSAQDTQLTPRTVNPEIYSSWINNQLIFDNKPLHEVVQLLEDNYGLEVVLENQEVLNRKLTGKYPADHVEVLLQAISDIFQLTVTKKDESVIIR